LPSFFTSLNLIMKLIDSKKIFIFDLDGTLVDAYRAIEDSLNYTRKKLDYPKISYKKVKESVGRGDKNFIKAFFKDKDIKKALKIYRKHHKKSLLKYAKLKKGALGLLNFLKKNKKIIALASNRPKVFTLLILKKLSIKKYFDMILCADEINSHKPSPKILNNIIKKFSLDKKDVVYIGDMDIDLEAAKRAKVDAVFIKGGSSKVSDIKKYKDKIVINSLEEIYDG